MVFNIYIPCDHLTTLWSFFVLPDVQSTTDSTPVESPPILHLTIPRLSLPLEFAQTTPPILDLFLQVVKQVPAMTPDVQYALIKDIRRRMTPQPLKIRADIELKCFQYDGVLHIQDAMRKGEKAGSEDCPVKIKLVAPPLYVLTTQTLDKVSNLRFYHLFVVSSLRGSFRPRLLPVLSFVRGEMHGA